MAIQTNNITDAVKFMCMNIKKDPGKDILSLNLIDF